MATVKVSHDIKAPVDQVFAMFTDIERGPEHVSNIKQIDVMSLGPFELGTRWRETREVMGRLDEAEMEVTAYEKNKTYTISHRKGPVRIDTVFTFTPVPAGTQVSIEFEMNRQRLPNALLSPIEWAIAGKVRDVLSQDLMDLKESVEKVAAV